MAQMELRSGNTVGEDEPEIDSDHGEDGNFQFLMKHGYAEGGYGETDDYYVEKKEEEPPAAPPTRLHISDISSVHHSLTSAMTSADEASAHRRPASPSDVVKACKFKSGTQEVGFYAFVEREI